MLYHLPSRNNRYNNQDCGKAERSTGEIALIFKNNALKLEKKLDFPNDFTYIFFFFQKSKKQVRFALLHPLISMGGITLKTEKRSEILFFISC